MVLVARFFVDISPAMYYFENLIFVSSLDNVIYHLHSSSNASNCSQGLAL